MFLRDKFVKMSPAGDGDGTGDATQVVVDADAASNKTQIELLTRSVGLIAEGLSKMEGNQSTIVATLAEITKQSKGDVRQQLEEDFGKDIDVEQLDRKQFASFILANAKKDLQAEMKKLMDGVDSRVTDLAGRFETKNANEQVTKTAELNADFWEWSSEIKQLLKDNPTLSVSRAYNLAKAENPTRLAELDKKYKPAKKENKERSFLGLTPTSSLGTRDSGTGKMTQKEAAEKAFDTVMSDLGDTLQNGDLKIA